LGVDRLDLCPLQMRRRADVSSLWRRSRPFYGLAVHPGDAVKSALIRRGVRKAQHTLDAELYGALLEVDIPMKERWPFPVGMIRTDRRLHGRAVEAHPELLGPPQLAERPVDARALAVVP